MICKALNNISWLYSIVTFISISGGIFAIDMGNIFTNTQIIANDELEAKNIAVNRTETANSGQETSKGNKGTVIIILSALAATGVILFSIKAKYKRGREKIKSYLPNKTNEPSPSQEPEKTPGDTYFHLSLLKDLTKRCDLDCNDELSFFKLSRCVLDNGGNLVLEKMKKIIEDTSIQDNKERATGLIKKYDELKRNELKLEVDKGNEDPHTPRIYISAIGMYLKEFQLEDDAKEDFKKTIFKVMDRLYNKGKNQELEEFRDNMECLKKYIKENNKDYLKDEIDRIERKINASG